MLRRIVVAASVFVLGALLAACGGEDDSPRSTDPGASESPTESTEPTSTTPPWESKYTSAQLDAYEAALARWEAYEHRSEPIWAEGRATDRAEALFKQYFPSPLWETYYNRLQSYEAAKVKIEGTPGVYWSQPHSISRNGLSVELQQCVDYTAGTTTQNGKEAAVPGWVKKPNLRTISLSKPKGYDWLIYSVTDASAGKARPCKP